jgi:hypothetical protein
MWTVEEGFKTSSFIEFGSAGELVIACFFMLIALFGTVSLIIVIMSTIKQSGNSAGTLLVMSLCLADLSYCFPSFIYTLINVASGGWAEGYVGCVLNHIIVIHSCFASVLSLLAITFERYIAIIHGKTMTNMQAMIGIAGIWISSFLISILPIITNSVGPSIALQTAKLICTLTWTSSIPLVSFQIWLCIITLMTVVFFMCFAYFQIVRVYMVAQRNVNQEKTSQTTSLTESLKQGKFSKEEKKLLMKAITISSTFVICWTPYLLL